MAASDTADGVDLTRIERQVFEDSENPQFSGLTEERQAPGPEYHQDRIFVGWELGGQDEYEQLVNKVMSRIQHQRDISSPKKIKNQAYQKALRNLHSVMGDRKRLLHIDRGNADLTFDGGERGSGKSFNLRARINQNHKSGVTSLVVDPEHEYYTNNQYNGIQNRLENLRRGEEPETLATKVLMPYSVYKAREDQNMPQNGYDDTEFFKFEFRELDPNDLRFVLARKFKDHPDFYAFVSELEERISRGELIQHWGDVKDVADEMQDNDEFEYQKRGRQIKRFIEMNYEKWDFLGPNTRQRLDLKTVLQEYDTVVLSLYDNERLPDDLYIKELCVKLFVKRVRDLIQRNEIPKPVDLVVDEAHRYAPAGAEASEHPSKGEVQRVIKRDRKRGFRVSLASQEPTDVARDNFLNQTKHFFIPQNMKPAPRRYLLRQADVWGSGYEGQEMWSRVFDTMKRIGPHDHLWLYVNAETGYWSIIEPVSPIAYHREE